MRGQATGTLAAAARGDEHALGLLWREVNPALIRYLRVQAGEAADELASATWIDLVRDLARFGGDDRAWRVHVFTVARRHLVAWQRDKRRRENSVAEAIGRHVAPPTKTVAAAVTDVAIDVLSSLPHEQAEALVLRTAAHLPVRDVARVMKLSEARTEAAIHSAAAGAAAIASSAQHRREVDDGRPAHVVHPQDGPAHIAGLTGNDAALERLLAGQPIGSGAPPSLRLVSDMFAALAAPPLDDELTGVGPALVSFRAQFAGRAAHRRRLAPGLAGAMVAASIAIGATLVGAYTAVLPEPLQRLAHAWIHAPAPHSKPSAPPSKRPEPARSKSGQRPAGGAASHASGAAHVRGRASSTHGGGYVATVPRHGDAASSNAPVAPTNAPVGTSTSDTPSSGVASAPPSTSSKRHGPKPTPTHGKPSRTPSARPGRRSSGPATRTPPPERKRSP